MKGSKMRDLKDLNTAAVTRIRAMYADHGMGQENVQRVARTFSISEASAGALAEAIREPRPEPARFDPKTSIASKVSTQVLESVATTMQRANAAESDMSRATLQQLEAWAALAWTRRAHVLG
jgi:hypothetical protein